jgi:hypothetical protein
MLLVVSHRPSAAYLDELAKGVAARWWPEADVHKLDEAWPHQSALIAFQAEVPLLHRTIHIEGCQPYLFIVGGTGGAEELLPAVRPGYRVGGAINLGEAQFVRRRW